MKKNLTKQEWVIMETLWDKNPMFLSDIMEQMDKRVNWTRSTYLTYLKKMVSDGYIAYETIRGSRLYTPIVGREECMVNESRFLMSHMTNDSAMYFVTNMIKEGRLSEKDREELKSLIDELGHAKEKTKRTSK